MLLWVRFIQWNQKVLKFIKIFTQKSKQMSSDQDQSANKMLNSGISINLRKLINDADVDMDNYEATTKLKQKEYNLLEKKSKLNESQSEPQHVTSSRLRGVRREQTKKIFKSTILESNQLEQKTEQFHFQLQKHNKALKQNFQNAAAQIDSLQKQLEQAEQNKEVILAELTDKENQIKQLELDNKQLKNQLNEAHDQLRIEKQRVKDLMKEKQVQVSQLKNDVDIPKQQYTQKPKEGSQKILKSQFPEQVTPVQQPQDKTQYFTGISQRPNNKIIEESNQKLIKQIQYLVSINKTLNNQILHLTLSSSTFTKQIQSHVSSNQTLTKQIQQRDQEKSLLEKNVQKIISQKQELNTKIQSLILQNQNYKEKNMSFDHLNKRIQTLLSEREDLNKKIQTLTSDNQKSLQKSQQLGTQKRLKQFQIQKQDLKNKLTVSENQLKDQQTTNEQLLQQLKDLRTQNSSIKCELENLECKMQILSKRSIDRQQEINTLRDELEIKDQQGKQVKEKLEEARRLIDDGNGGRQLLNQQALSMKQSILQLKQQISIITTQRVLAESQAHNLSSQLTLLQQQLAVTHAQLTQSQGKLSSYDLMESALDDLGQQLEKMTITVIEKEEEIDGLKGEVEKSRMELKSVQQRCADLCHRLRANNTDITNLQHELTSTKNQSNLIKQNLQTKLLHLNQQLHTYQHPLTIHQRFSLIQKWFKSPSFNITDRIVFMNWTEQFFLQLGLNYNEADQAFVDGLGCVVTKRIRVSE